MEILAFKLAFEAAACRSVQLVSIDDEKERITIHPSCLPLDAISDLCPTRKKFIVRFFVNELRKRESRHSFSTAEIFRFRFLFRAEDEEAAIGIPVIDHLCLPPYHVPNGFFQILKRNRFEKLRMMEKIISISTSICKGRIFHASASLILSVEMIPMS